MQILINDLNLSLQTQKPLLMEAMERVLDSGWVVLGPELQHFETKFADYIGVQHCVGVGNGTDAIEIGLRALGIASGDMVATAANAAMYTATALIAIGAEPYFIDVDMTSQCITVEEVNRAICSGVKAVVVTHLYGKLAPNIKEIAKNCKQAGVLLFEDCAQAHGAHIAGKKAGSFGDAASFSFYPTKNLGGIGDGGAVLTHNEDTAHMARRYRQYGWGNKYEVDFMGGRNSRLDELQAAFLSVALQNLDENNAKRRVIAKQYNDGIRHEKAGVPSHNGSDYVAHLYVIQSDKRDELRAHLKTCNIASDIHYPIPDHRQSVFGCKFDSVYLPQTEKLAKTVLTLPCYPDLTKDQVAIVIAGVNSWSV